MSLLTPDTISESHTFGNDEHKVGSKLAPSYQGKLISVSYNYEVRVWHHATFGSDDVSLLEIPVIVACETPIIF